VAPLDHPDLMEIHAVHHMQDGTIGIAVERRRGWTLAERIAAEGPVSPAEAERILRSAAAALGYLHGRGVIHRGVRPQSIFIDRDGGRARLAHFGIDATAEDARGPFAARPSPDAYLAPEQLEDRGRGDDRRATPRSDLYSLGLVGYAMLTGRQPGEDDLATKPAGQPARKMLPLLTTLRPDVPDHLCRAIHGCLEPNPRRRWRSTDEFLARLDPHAEDPRRRWAIDLSTVYEPIATRLARLRELQRRIGDSRRRLLAIGASAALAGLVALNLIRGSGDGTLAVVEAPDASPGAEATWSPRAAHEENAIPSGAVSGSTTDISAAASAERAGVPLGRPGSGPASGAVVPLPHPGSDVGAAASQRSRPLSSTASTRAGIQAAGDPAGSARLVLLGDPVDRQPAQQPLLGDVIQPQE
jgi:serine/threonine protein kinase